MEPETCDHVISAHVTRTTHLVYAAPQYDDVILTSPVHTAPTLSIIHPAILCPLPGFSASPVSSTPPRNTSQSDSPSSSSSAEIIEDVETSHGVPPRSIYEYENLAFVHELPPSIPTNRCLRKVSSCSGATPQRRNSSNITSCFGSKIATTGFSEHETSKGWCELHRGSAQTNGSVSGQFSEVSLVSESNGNIATINGLFYGAGSADVSPTGPGSTSEGDFGSSHAELVGPVVMQDTGESFLRILVEIALPFVMAGMGCVFAGVVLDRVQHWRVFKEVSEVFILVPALLGLKGNLEMTLASRLSTQANLGHLDTAAEQWKMIGGNLALTQMQAVVVGFLAAMLAILLGWAPTGKFDVLHGFLLCTSSVITASVASAVLGSVMVGVVLLSRRFHINPDNIATPFGGALGDLTTISLLSSIVMILFSSLETHVWLCPALLCCWLAMAPLWWTISYRNKYTRDILHSGWVPVIGAMAISSVGGLILDLVVKIYEGIAVFQPVVNGVGGNLVAVQASRLATALHRTTVPSILPSNAVHGCPNILTTFFSKRTSAVTARALMLLVVPGHLVFMFTIQAFSAGHMHITPSFAALFLTATVIQVATLLFIANWIVYFVWGRGNDPDNYSIPYLTAIGDLLGGALLALVFFTYNKLGLTI